MAMNPSRTDIINYITEKAKSIGVDARTALATAWTESGLTQFKDGKTLEGKNATSTDIGIMQINDKSWSDTYDVNKLYTDWKYNVDAGLNILKSKFDTATKAGVSSIPQSSYSAYNTGSDYNRYVTMKDYRDVNFKKNYDSEPWKAFSVFDPSVYGSNKIPQINAPANTFGEVKNGKIVPENSSSATVVVGEQSIAEYPKVSTSDVGLSTFQNVVRLIIIAGISVVVVILFVLLLNKPVGQVSNVLNKVERSLS